MPHDLFLAAIYRLRGLTGGLEPWSQSGPEGQRGGFAWTDPGGRGYEVVIRPGGTPVHWHDMAWKTVLLGNDFALLSDPAAWRRAVARQHGEWEEDKK